VRAERARARAMRSSLALGDDASAVVEFYVRGIARNRAREDETTDGARARSLRSRTVRMDRFPPLPAPR